MKNMIKDVKCFNGLLWWV